MAAAGSFDAVLTVNTIQLWRPFAASVREVARVLRPGGRLISYTHDWAIRRSSGLDVDDWAAQTAASCRQCGLAEPRWWRARADRGSSIAFVAAGLGPGGSRHRRDRASFRKTGLRSHRAPPASRTGCAGPAGTP
jgi:SAM-dependent methyltransferase